MEYISHLSLDQLPPIPTVNLTIASRYLLMPVLALFSHPRYSSIYSNNINLLNKDDLNREYGVILRIGIIDNWTDLITYLFEHTSDQNHTQDDISGLVTSAQYDRLPIFLALVGRGIPPNANDFGLTTLRASVGDGSLDVLQWLVDNAQFPQDRWDEECAGSYFNGRPELVRIISPRVSERTRKLLLDLAIRCNRTNMINAIQGI